ncbi:MAG: acetyl-CoA carboxylase, biotin carboxyl carrier protein, partial [Sphingomonas bacterium]
MADNEDNKGAMKVDVGLVRQLAELLDTTQLTEIEVEDGDRKIRVARKAAAAPAVHYAPAPAAAPV